jgi:hypothetical protein
MLVGMDISPAGPWTGPWLVLAIVLGIALAVLGAVLMLRRHGSRGPAAGTEAGAADRQRAYGDDDLPGFLESPPGSTRRAASPAGGWPSLGGGTDASATAPAAAAGKGRRRAAVLGAVALTALLMVAVVAVLVFAGRDGTAGPGRGGPHDRGTADLAPPPATPSPGDPGAGALADAAVRPGRGGGAARLEFAGLVLEQRAVGVTATYPALDASWNGRRAVAHLRLPTFNCLSATAPEDPVAAGCVASVTEYADLPSPALTVTGDDGRVQLSGRFPTYVRPNGSPPVWTGRVYEIGVRAAPVDGEPTDGWVRAEGEIRLGSGQAPTVDDPDVTVLTRD